MMAFLGAAGFLAFNHALSGALLLWLASFCVCAASCAFNNTTDVKEDTSNNRGIVIPGRKFSYPIIFVFFATGFIFASYVSALSLAFYLLVMFSGVLYSGLRLKEYTGVKNLNSGFVLPLLFLMGAGLSYQSLVSYFLISLFVFAGSIVSDIRDHDGDAKAGVKTLSVRYGRDVAKKTAYISLLIVLSLVIYLGIEKIIILPVFSIAMIGLIELDMPRKAHGVAAFSFVGLAAWSLIS